ncbi:hypothetical protein [Paenirhodobacter sp.]|uniref:hypothetical protein n=1 Tax=Paenirhodobacter sp. TaxID=1965326 RepID=UPI003B4241CD
MIRAVAPSPMRERIGIIGGKGRENCFSARKLMRMFHRKTVEIESQCLKQAIQRHNRTGHQAGKTRAGFAMQEKDKSRPTPVGDSSRTG